MSLIPGNGDTVRMRIVTWNLWWRFGDWESQAPIHQTLEHINADVICLQEVWSSETGQDQVKELAEHLNLHLRERLNVGGTVTLSETPF